MSGNGKGKTKVFFRSPCSGTLVRAIIQPYLFTSIRFESVKRERPLEPYREKKRMSDVQSTRSKAKNYSLQSFKKLS